MTNETLDHLHQFLGAYFNEDWMTEYRKADDVINAFASESTLEAISEVKKEIKSLLRADHDEDVLREFLLKDMSCCYCYWHDWESGKIWLNHIFEFLSEGRVLGLSAKNESAP